MLTVPLDTTPPRPAAWHPRSSQADLPGGSRFSLQLASVLHENQPSRLRWLRKPFPTAGNSCRHTGCDLINTALYFSFLLNVTAAAAALPLCPRWGTAALLGPAQASLFVGLTAIGASARVGAGAQAAAPAAVWPPEGSWAPAPGRETQRVMAPREPSPQLRQTVVSHLHGVGTTAHNRLASHPMTCACPLLGSHCAYAVSSGL